MTPPLPDLESLRCFEVASTQLNFRVAARQVALSPPAFSDRIRRLEDQLGAPLFVRTTRKVELSRAGRALLPQARRTLEEARRCAEAIHSPAGRTPFVIRLGTRFELGLSWLTPSLNLLSRERAERSLQLYFADSADLLARVRDGRLDAVITSARLTNAGLRYRVLHDESYVLVATPALLKQKPLRTPVHAAAHALLDLHADLPLFRYFFEACPPEQVWGFARSELLGTIAAIRQRLLLGSGVAVLPRYFVQEDLRARRLTALFPRLPLQRDFFRLIWREEHPLEPEFDALAGELRRIPLR